MVFILTMQNLQGEDVSQVFLVTKLSHYFVIYQAEF